MININIEVLNLLCLITGILYIILAAKGNIWTYFWSIINILLYSYISYTVNYTGDFLINLTFELPIQIIGLIAWYRHYDHDNKEVEVKELTKKSKYILVIICLFSIVLLTYILPILNKFLNMGNNPSILIDSITTVFMLVTIVLMILRYSEQWVTWLIVDLFNIIMWLIIGDNLLIVIMWFIDFIISIYGYYNWKQLSENQKNRKFKKIEEKLRNKN